MTEYLLKKGSDPDYRLVGKFKNRKKHFKGMSALLFSIDQNRLGIANTLLKRKVDISVKNHRGIGALSLASFRCNLPMMQQLIKKKANINERSKGGLTPLHYAAQGKGCLTSILYLKKIGADDSLLTNDGKTYIQYAKKANPSFSRELIFYNNLIIK